MTLLQSWFWPDLSSRKNALAAINETFWVTMFLAGLTAVFTFIDFARDWQAIGCGASLAPPFLPASPLAFRHKSRAAALAGFGCISLEGPGVGWHPVIRGASSCLFW